MLFDAVPQYAGLKRPKHHFMTHVAQDVSRLALRASPRLLVLWLAGAACEPDQCGGCEVEPQVLSWPLASFVGVDDDADEHAARSRLRAGVKKTVDGAFAHGAERCASARSEKSVTFSQICVTYVCRSSLTFLV